MAGRTVGRRRMKVCGGRSSSSIHVGSDNGRRVIAARARWRHPQSRRTRSLPPGRRGGLVKCVRRHEGAIIDDLFLANSFCSRRFAHAPYLPPLLPVVLLLLQVFLVASKTFSIGLLMAIINSQIPPSTW